MSLNSIELFAGAGALALSIGMTGCLSRAVVEWDKWACDAVRQNQLRGHPLFAGLFAGDGAQAVA